MTINEQMTEAITSGSSLLAHALMLGIRYEYWQPEDPAETIDFDKLDFAEVENAVKENILGIQFSILYAVPLEKNEFAMFYADNSEQVEKLFRQNFGQKCSKVIWMEHGMDRSMYFEEKKQHMTWREARIFYPETPAYAGVFQK